MRTFQLIFKGGRVQNIQADRYVAQRRDLMFVSEEGASQKFRKSEVIMIDEIEDDDMSPQAAMPYAQ